MCLLSTYEELKLNKKWDSLGIAFSLLSTYEELKLGLVKSFENVSFGLLSTYEELKPLGFREENENETVYYLPMRN